MLKKYLNNAVSLLKKMENQYFDLQQVFKALYDAQILSA